MDTGTYNLASNIAVGLGDGGSSGNPVVFMGTTDPAGTVLDRNAVGTTTSTTFSVTGNYVRMERFRCTRAWYGVYLVGTGGEVVNCEAYGNGSDGVRIEGPTGALNSVTGCLVRDNPGTCVCCYSSSSVSAVISDNVIRTTEWASTVFAASPWLSHATWSIPTQGMASMDTRQTVRRLWRTM